MKFREHRGSLAESMLTVREIDGLHDLMLHCLTFVPLVGDDDLTVEPYRRDERTGWDTHVVKLKGYGVVGFMDGPLSREAPRVGRSVRPPPPGASDRRRPAVGLPRRW